MKAVIWLLFPVIMNIASEEQNVISHSETQVKTEISDLAFVEDVDGAKVYRKKCQWCHGKDGNKTKKDVASLMKSQLSEQEKTDIVKNGKGVMPPFGPALSDEEVDAVVTFIGNFTNP